MQNIKKIMVAMGFTDYDRETFQFAQKFAQSMSAELIIGSVINSKDVEAVGTISAMGYEVDGQQYIDGVKKERKQMLAEFFKNFPSTPESVGLIFRVGHPIGELLKLIVEEKIDLVIMGVKGRSDLEHVFVGSVAEKLFRKSPVPIISYRDKKSAARLRKRIRPA